MTKLTFVKFCLIIWPFFYKLFGEKIPNFSANSTIVEVNKTISFKCDVAQLDNWSTSNYEVHFTFNSNYFSYAYYAITCKFVKKITKT